MALLAALAVSPPASAKDLMSLSRLLTPAYTAMNYAAVCASDPPWARSQPTGVRGTAFHYAEHVKDEVIAGLSPDEALTVLRLAADDARADTRERLRTSVAAGEAHLEAARLKGWCEGHAGEFIAALIETHDNDHQAFLERLARSKLFDRRRQAKLARSAGASPARVRPSKLPGSECCVRRRRRRTRSVHSGCVGCVIEPRNGASQGQRSLSRSNAT